MLELKNRFITDYLTDNAKNLSDKPALIFEDKTYSWSEFLKKVEQAANFVLSQLEQPDEQKIIGVLMPNSDEFIFSYFGIIHAGHIAMPLDPNFKDLEFHQVVDQMHPEFTITNKDYQEHFRSSDKFIIYDEINDSKNASIQPLRLTPQTQIASMLFTSGTTGNPKSVPYTHANHMWNPAVVSKLWEWSEDDTLLISLALSHWHGLVMGLDGALYHGNTIYLQQWFNAKDTIEMLQGGKISLFMHVPIAYFKMIEYAKEQNETFDISKVRLCISGSSFLPPKLWHEFKQYFGQEILERYGANEMGLLTSNTLDKRLPGCVGKPLPDVKIEIQEDGEIAMSSPGLFPGYYKNQEANKKQRLANGMWLSGDIGEFDSEGRIHLKGRVQEKMKKLGYTVYPRDVEWAVAQHPKVEEVAVISVQSDEKLSDEFVFFVVGSVSDEELADYCKKELPNYWRPDRVIRLKEIPRTGRTSKPAIKELKARL